MAYCLRSFIETLDQVLDPDNKYHKKWVLDHDQRLQIQSLYDNATFLQNFLDESSPEIQERISSLEDKIMNAAQKAADALETKILLNPEDQNFTIIPQDLGEVIRVFEGARQEMSKIEDPSQPPNHAVPPPVSSTCYPDSKNVLVGVEEDLNQLRSRLTSAQVTKLDIIPIVGMGGIGKTTLARLLYEEHASRSHFDICAWVTISQIYDPQQIFQTILDCVPEKLKSKQKTKDLTLFQTLYDRRYLIVLDDIWNSDAWDGVKKLFHRGNQGSRIIITTRDNSWADYVNSKGHEMRLITGNNRWELLRGIVFGKKPCPPELEEAGIRIASKCGGLPLALELIGGILAHSQRSKRSWEHVAKNVSSLLAGTDDQFDGILSYSFAHLPHYLKPCFLYMGGFPEDYDIPASRLINLWVAEGFLYSLPYKSPEEAAESQLNALVNRNLIFIRTKSSNGKAKSYGIHDLLRNLCLEKAREKKFLYVKDSRTDITQENMSALRRVSMYPTNKTAKVFYGSLKLKPYVRSFILGGNDETNKFNEHLCYESSLLRVLDMETAAMYKFQTMFLQLINLRYLSINDERYRAEAKGLSAFKNLQTLRLWGIESLAILNDLPQLRNLHVYFLRDNNGTLSHKHDNLQRLSNVRVGNLKNVLDKFPNLKKLGLKDDRKPHKGVVDLTCFTNLESFSLISIHADFTLPQSLKRLKLWKSTISQNFLKEIGILPGLEVLKLHICTFKENMWKPTEGEFEKLQYLYIKDLKLKNWLADETNFPGLQHLVLQDCSELNEIPDFGESVTLEIIEVDRCGDSVLDSARTILDKQIEYGNTLQLRINGVLVEEEKEEE